MEIGLGLVEVDARRQVAVQEARLGEGEVRLLGARGDRSDDAQVLAAAEKLLSV